MKRAPVAAGLIVLALASPAAAQSDRGALQDETLRRLQE
jgi:hypothetical protein